MMRNARALPLGFALLAMCSGSLIAETLPLHLEFKAENRSMWGPGAAVSFSKTYYILDPNTVNWNFSYPGPPNYNVASNDNSTYSGSFFSQDTYLFGTASFGAGVRAQSTGRIGLWTTFDLTNAGSVDVDYPVGVELNFPDANSFRAGDTISVSSSYVSEPDWKLSTISPQFSFRLDGEYNIVADARAKGCIFACLDTSSFIPTVNLSSGGAFNIFTIQPGSTFVTPGWLAMALNSPLTVSGGVPNIQTTGIRESNQRSLLATGSDKFLGLELDVAGMVAAALRVPIPLEFNTDDITNAPFGKPPDLKGFKFSYTLLHGALVTDLSARQRFRFTPDLKVSFTFHRPLEHWVGSGPHSTGQSVEMRVGETLNVRYPSDIKEPTPLNPTFRLDNTFESSTRIGITGDFDVKAGAVAATTPKIEVFPRLCTPAFCTPEVEVAGVTIIPEICVPEICTDAVSINPISFAVGPLYSRLFPLFSTDIGPPIFEGSWQIDFASQATTGFSLDPENPSIAIDKVMTSAVNLGGGKRRVTYVIDITNTGDVALNDVHLIDNLIVAYAAAAGFTVNQVSGCNGMTANSAYDGKTDLNLLGVTGNTLAPLAKRRIILVTTISPRPDPAPYVNTSTTDGTSALGTNVAGSDSATVTLGPAIISGLDDLVVFGEHFVKLDAIADSSGTIASNDFIEVKNGSSGIVAGDLRAGRNARVSGSITTDYVWSGGSIDVVGKGRLTLTGNMKPFANVPALSVPAVVFAPSTAFAGDVFVPFGGATNLSPGYYGTVTISRGGALNLATGDYSIARLVVGESATLAATGVAKITAGDLEIGARAVIGSAGSSRDLVLNVSKPGAISVGNAAQLRGILTAPRSNISFGPMSVLEGSVRGQSVTLMPGVRVNTHRNCDPIADPDCDGTASCP